MIKIVLLERNICGQASASNLLYTKKVLLNFGIPRTPISYIYFCDFCGPPNTLK